MKIHLIFLLLFVEVYTAQIASWLSGSQQPGEGRVVGGHEAKAHSHPYMVSLQLRFLWVRAHFCGGTLLSQSWVGFVYDCGARFTYCDYCEMHFYVILLNYGKTAPLISLSSYVAPINMDTYRTILTAGHCIKESWIIRWLPVDAIAGAHNVDSFDSKVQIAQISERIAHPDYKGGIGAHDIAVLKTSTPFTFTRELQPIQLPTRNLKYEDIENLTLSGWGALRTTSFLPDLPSKLQEVDVTYMSYKKCYSAIDDIKEFYESNPLSSESNMCTGPISGGIAACNGDSGGPLVYYLPNNAENSQVKVSSTAKSTTIESDDYDVIIDVSFFDDDARSADFKTNVNKARRKRDNATAIILGVVSWGVSPCGEKGAPTVYTKVSPYLDFINKHIMS